MCVHNLTLQPSPRSRLPHVVPRARLFALVPVLHPPYLMVSLHVCVPPSFEQLPRASCFLFSLLPKLWAHGSGSLKGSSHLILTTALGHRYQIHTYLTEEDTTEKTATLPTIACWGVEE